MTRDYAKKTKKSRSYSSPRSKSAAQSGIPSWIWLFTGVFFGVGLAIFVFWKWNKTLEHHTQTPPIVVTDNQSAPLVDKSIEEETKSRFDFYTLLPNLKVDVRENEAPAQKTTQAESKPTEVKSAETKGAPLEPAKENVDAKLAYIIQAGSFRAYDQAEHLKANLAMSGFESQIQTVNIKPQETWYRVYLGPYKSKDDALVTQQNLERHHAFNSLILKIRV